MLLLLEHGLQLLILGNHSWRSFASKVGHWVVDLAQKLVSQIPELGVVSD